MKRIRIPMALWVGIAIVFGLMLGGLANYFGFQVIVRDWISPLGQLFLQLLKAVAIPLIMVSLIGGIVGLGDNQHLAKLGRVTILAYLLTTILAAILGLFLVNSIQPGHWIAEATRAKIISQYPFEAINNAPVSYSLNFLLDFVPENFFAAVTDNKNMLHVIFISLSFGIAALNVTTQSRNQIVTFFQSLNEVVMNLVRYVMYLAPIGVFALMADVLISIPDLGLIRALLVYGFTVMLGLAILLYLVYPLLAKWLGGIPYRSFLKNIFPAQLIAISTSSSAATLPVTIKCVEEALGVRKKIAHFVLPIAATVSMDATALYQAIATLFITQVFGIDLSFTAQCILVASVTLASIGAAAVPSAGIITLTIVLEQFGIPLEGLALIIALDRPLDMFRTATNITSDAAVATAIDKII